MNLFSVLDLVRAFNKDKPSLFGPDAPYKFSSAQNEKIFEIFVAIKKLQPPYDVSVKIIENCGQVYLACKEKKEEKLPPIRRAMSKV